MLNKTTVMLSTDLDKVLGRQNTQVTQTGLSTSHNALELVGLVLLLIIILIAAYYTTRFIGGMKLGQLKTSNFQVIDSYRISSNKMMQIVKVGNKFLLIAIAKDSINFITELDEAEVHIKEFQTVDKQSFKQILDKIRNNKE